MNAPGNVAITAAAFGAKYSSKREVYNFLSVDVGIYLPSYRKWWITLFLTFLFLIFSTSHHLLSQRRGKR